MRLEELYPLKGFKITEITQTPSDKVLIKAVSTSRSATCPYCQTPSHKRHSSYNRKPQALPCSDTPAQLVLSVQRYFCQDPDCIRKTFAERIPDTASFYARRTTCLETVLKYIAFEMSAEAASRVCEQFNVQISADSVLRLIRRTHLSRAEQVRVLGVDDWAIKKGQNYGTILVDLERRRTIELFPDRTQDTLSKWLKRHPEIEVISRDRSFEYKAGIETGAPQAMQVVDRWHLLHNLREKLQEIIPGQRKKGNSDKKTMETPSYHQRKKYFELVKYLHDKGYSQRTIARVLGISRGTVRRYQEEANVPDWRPRKRLPSQLDAYEKYLRRRWAEGCRDITTLWKELQQKGYRGKRKSVARYLQRFREQTPFRSTRQLAWLFMKDASELQDEESAQLVSLFKECPKLREIYQHAQTFQQMIAQQLPERLDDWLVQMESCAFPVLDIKIERNERGTEVLPEKLSSISRYSEAEAANRRSPRDFTLAMGMGMRWMINGRTFGMEDIARDEVVKLGDLEAWQFTNQASGGMGMMGGMALPHPMHIHGLQFQVVEREVDTSGRAAWETISAGYVDEGWHDTVLVMPGERVKILLKFEDFEGLYLYHCHNLEHEDMGMMRNYRVEA